MQLDGFQVRNIGSFANLTNMFPDMGATQEMTIDYAAGLGEAATGGVKVNYVPREGGNTFQLLVLRHRRQLRRSRATTTRTS